MNNIRIAVCDDAEYLCLSIKMLVASDDEIEFCGEAHCVEECIELVNNNKIDILLLDIQMETETAGVKAIPILLNLNPNMKIIMLTSYGDEEYIFSAFANGASDYIIKKTNMNSIIGVIKDVYNNSSTLKPEIAQILSKKAREIADNQSSLLFLVNIMTKLSHSEFEVLKALCDGQSYRDIAKKRFVEENSIRKLASNAMKKFNAVSLKSLVNELQIKKIFELFKIDVTFR